MTPADHRETTPDVEDVVLPEARQPNARGLFRFPCRSGHRSRKSHPINRRPEPIRAEKSKAIKNMTTKKRGEGKISGMAKENIAAVFVRLGGTAEMARWAKANQTEFYRLYARLVPHEVTGAGGGPIAARVSVEFVRPNP